MTEIKSYSSLFEADFYDDVASQGAGQNAAASGPINDSPYALLELVDANFAAFNEDYRAAIDSLMASISELSEVIAQIDSAADASEAKQQASSALERSQKASDFVSKVAEREKDVVQAQKSIAKALGAEASGDASEVAAAIEQKLSTELGMSAQAALNHTADSKALAAAVAARLIGDNAKDDAAKQEIEKIKSAAVKDINKSEAIAQIKAEAQIAAAASNAAVQLPKIQKELEAGKLSEERELTLKLLEKQYVARMEVAKSEEKTALAVLSQISEQKAKLKEMKKTASDANKQAIQAAKSELKELKKQAKELKKAAEKQYKEAKQAHKDAVKLQEKAAKKAAKEALKSAKKGEDGKIKIDDKLVNNAEKSVEKSDDEKKLEEAIKEAQSAKIAAADAATAINALKTTNGDALANGDVVAIKSNGEVIGKLTFKDSKFSFTADEITLSELKADAMSSELAKVKEDASVSDIAALISANATKIGELKITSVTTDLAYTVGDGAVAIKHSGLGAKLEKLAELKASDAVKDFAKAGATSIAGAEITKDDEKITVVHDSASYEISKASVASAAALIGATGKISLGEGVHLAKIAATGDKQLNALNAAKGDEVAVMSNDDPAVQIGTIKVLDGGKFSFKSKDGALEIAELAENIQLGALADLTGKATTYAQLKAAAASASQIKLDGTELKLAEGKLLAQGNEPKNDATVVQLGDYFGEDGRTLGKLAAITDISEGVKILNKSGGDTIIATLKTITTAQAVAFLTGAQKTLLKKLAGLNDVATAAQDKLLAVSFNDAALKELNDEAYAREFTTTGTYTKGKAEIPFQFALVGLDPKEKISTLAKALVQNDANSLRKLVAEDGKMVLNPDGTVAETKAALNGMGLVKIATAANTTANVKAGDALQVVTMFGEGYFQPGLIGSMQFSGLESDTLPSELLQKQSILDISKMLAANENGITLQLKGFKDGKDAAVVLAEMTANGTSFDVKGLDADSAWAHVSAKNVNFATVGSLKGIGGLSKTMGTLAAIDGAFDRGDNAQIKLGEYELVTTGADKNKTYALKFNDKISLDLGTLGGKMVLQSDGNYLLRTEAVEPDIYNKSSAIAQNETVQLKFSDKTDGATFKLLTTEALNALNNGAGSKIASIGAASDGAITATVEDASDAAAVLDAIRAQDNYKDAHQIYLLTATKGQASEKFIVYTGASDAADDDIVIKLAGVGGSINGLGTISSGELSISVAANQA